MSGSSTTPTRSRPTDARVVVPRWKASATIRLDADLLQWFGSKRGYQTRIDSIVRGYMRPMPTSDAKRADSNRVGRP